MRVPGLRETLSELRFGVDEMMLPVSGDSVAMTTSGPNLTPQADAAMSGRLTEVEETIMRCRNACANFADRDVKEQTNRKLDDRLNAVS